MAKARATGLPMIRDRMSGSVKSLPGPIGVCRRVADTACSACVGRPIHPSHCRQTAGATVCAAIMGCASSDQGTEETQRWRQPTLGSQHIQSVTKISPKIYYAKADQVHFRCNVSSSPSCAAIQTAQQLGFGRAPSDTYALDHSHLILLKLRRLRLEVCFCV